jgi:ribose transport system substrate-binding protein
MPCFVGMTRWQVALTALASAGKTSVKVFGFDGAEDVIEAIRNHKIEATGMQFPQLIAERAAILAMNISRAGGTLPRKCQ